MIAIPGGARTGNLSPAATDIATVIQDLGFVAAALFLARRASRRCAARQFGLRRAAPWRRAIGAASPPRSCSSCSPSAYFAVLHSSGQEKEFVKEIGGNGDTLGILAACAVTCVVAPICEELLFRGFVFRALRNWRGVWPAAAITGVLFGAVHGLSAPAVDLLPLAFLGFVLCIVYERSGSLYPCIALHVLNNAIALGADEHWGAGRAVALARRRRSPRSRSCSRSWV